MKSKFSSLIAVLCLCLFITTSCNYLAGFIGNGLAGLASYPITALRKAFEDGTEDFYEQFLESQDTVSLERQLREINNCKFFLGVELPDTLTNLQQAINQRSCLGCVPWGQTFECKSLPNVMTDKELRQSLGRRADEILLDFPRLIGNCCSTSCPDKCERMCPESSAIMSDSRRNAIPYRENTIPVVNDGENFSDPEEHSSRPNEIEPYTGFNGVCHGHSTVRANIAALGQFDRPDEKPRTPVGENGQPLTGDRLEDFYKDVLRDLARGKVRDVPGVKNVRELTSRPGIAPVLREEILRSFHEQVRLNPFLVESLSAKRDFNKTKYENEISLIKKNIEVAGTAQVTVGFDSGGGHTVEVYKVFDITVNNRKAKKLCIIDSNKNICQIDYSQDGAPCVSGFQEYISQRWTPSESNLEQGVYCPRYMISYDDDYSFDFPGHGINHNNSFTVDAQQDRNVNNAISKLSEYCKEKRGCD